MRFIFLMSLLFGIAVAIQLFYFAAVGFDLSDVNLPLILTFNATLIGLAVAFMPHILYLLIICYFPYIATGIEYEVGIVTLNPFTAGVIFLTVICFVRLFFGKVRISIGLADISLWLMCTVYMATTITSPTLIDTGQLAFTAIFIPVLALYVTRAMLQTEGQYMAAVRTLILSTTLFAVFALLSFAASGLRTKPLGIYPVSAATCLIIPLFYMVVSKPFPKFFRLLFILLCTAAFVLTFSRMYFAIMLISPALYMIVRKGKSGMYMLSYILGSLVLTLGIFVWAQDLQPPPGYKDSSLGSVQERVTSIDYFKYSIYGRIVQFKVGIENFKANPIVGKGLHKGLSIGTQHNFNIEWLEYGGVLGYIFYAGFFIFHAFRVGPLARSDPYMRAQLLVLIAVMANCLFNGIMHGLMPIVAFVIIGLNEARYRILQQQPELLEQPVIDVEGNESLQRAM